MELKISASDRLFTSSEMKQLEEAVCSNQKKSLLDLMEQAGTQVAALIAERYSHLKSSAGAISILAGPGNNGGDGLVVGRCLRDAGFNVQVILIESARYSSQLEQQISLYRQKNIGITFISEKKSPDPGYLSYDGLQNILLSADLIVDALLGTGQSGEPHGIIKKVCEIVSRVSIENPAAKIISVDVPTGINCDSGQVFETHISPDMTAVIQHLKTGQAQQPAKKLMGEIVILDAGIDGPESTGFCRFSVLHGQHHFIVLKERAVDSHKGRFGSILVLAGSESMPGAARLSALAALRSGAGTVTQLVRRCAEQSSEPEIMYLRGSADIGSELARELIPQLPKYSCVVVGPGLGMSAAVRDFVIEILDEVSKLMLPCVVDADGLNALAEVATNTVPFNLSSCVLTPHPGEAARLLNLTSSDIQFDRYRAAKMLYDRYGAAVILKGASTVCYDGEAGTVNQAGGPYLATAGSGDVLSGILAAMLVSPGLQQQRRKLQASSLSVYLHAKAAELAYSEHHGPIIASDIISKIPYAIGPYISV